jgi:membrane-associated protease RseP (regulator of RpoE activity)
MLNRKKRQLDCARVAARLGNLLTPRAQQKYTHERICSSDSFYLRLMKVGGFMIRKSLAFFLLGVAAGTAAYAQQTPAPKKDNAPSSFAWSFNGDGGYLGVQTQEVTRENFAKFGLREVRGVAVEKVMEKSPAEAAGIQPGDVIVRFNGEEVTSVRKLTRLIGEVDPDHQAKVTVVRGGSERDITVTVGKRPMPEFSNGNFEFNMPDLKGQWQNLPDLKNLPQLKDMPDFKDLPKGELKEFALPNGKGFVWSSAGQGRQIGVGIVPLSKQLAEHFRVDGGAMIDEVREDSPAAKAGLKAGDIIIEANGQAVKTQFDLVRIINEKKEGGVQLTIVRDGSRQTINVTPETSKDNFFFKSDGDNGSMAPDALPLLQQLKMAQPAAPMMPGQPMRLMLPGRMI